MKGTKTKDEKSVERFTKLGFTPNQIAIVLAKDAIMNLDDDPDFNDREFMAKMTRSGSGRER
jgi:hypothetical protein